MRRLAPILLAAFGAGCSASEPDPQTTPQTLANATVNETRAPLVPFEPPTPLGCAGAAAYDGCFAFDGATPLAVELVLPAETRKDDVVVVRFHRLAEDGEEAHRPLVADRVEFRVAARSALRLYFQVFRGSYQIEASVDLDRDGEAFGAHDASGWSSATASEAVFEQSRAAYVDVADTPVATAFTLALP